MKYIHYRLCLIFIILCCNTVSETHGQETNTRAIKSHENLSRLISLSNNYDLKEEKIQNKHNSNIENTSFLSEDIILPVVVHLLHHSTQSKISKAQIYAQIESLNNDFAMNLELPEHKAMEKEGFSSLAVDTGIKFCLASEDPNGNLVNGFSYYNVDNTTWSMDDKMKYSKFGGITAWDTKKYINIWVVDMEDQVSGYAQMPGHATVTDGIVIDYSFFGIDGHTKTPYNKGKTLTHLMGNYLNLYSLWGPSPCSDDEVEDTPIHNAPNFGNPRYKHISLCDGKSVEMTMNFMDNSDDEVLSMFTHGQKERMLNCLMNSRSELLESHVSCNEREELSHEDSNMGISIFPNPAIDKINVSFDNQYINQTIDLKVISSDHALILNKLITVDENSTVELVTSNWPAGVYMIYLTKAGEHFHSRKIIVVNQTN
jgi:hypothetical protein